MTAINHAATGALIAVVIDKPLIALPLAFLSHFVLDAIPHFGFAGHGGIGPALKHRISRYLDVVDPLLFLVLILVLLHFSTGIYVFIAAALASMLDIEWLYAYFLYERRGKKAPQSPIAKWHEQIQWCERPWGIYVEGVWLVVMMTLLINTLK